MKILAFTIFLYYKDIMQDVVDHWFKTPFIIPERECYSPVSQNEEEILPTYGEGCCKVSDPLWANEDNIVVKKYDNIRHLAIIERLTSKLGQCLQAPVSPSRLYKNKQGRLVTFSLVMEERGECDKLISLGEYLNRISEKDLSKETAIVELFGGYYGFYDTLARLITLNLLSGNDGESLWGHTIKTSKGIAVFDFNAGQHFDIDAVINVNSQWEELDEDPLFAIWFLPAILKDTDFSPFFDECAFLSKELPRDKKEILQFRDVVVQRMDHIVNMKPIKVDGDFVDYDFRDGAKSGIEPCLPKFFDHLLSLKL